MKRLIPLLLCIATLLCACGNPASVDGGASSPPAPTARHEVLATPVVLDDSGDEKLFPVASVGINPEYRDKLEATTAASAIITYEKLAGALNEGAFTEEDAKSDTPYAVALSDDFAVIVKNMPKTGLSPESIDAHNRIVGLAITCVDAEKELSLVLLAEKYDESGFTGDARKFETTDGMVEVKSPEEHIVRYCEYRDTLLLEVGRFQREYLTVE